MHIAVYANRWHSPSGIEFAARLALCAASGALAIYIVGLYLYVGAVVSFPYPIDYTESPLVSAALTMAEGGNPYEGNPSLPSVGAVYTPIYYLVSAATFAILGPNLIAPRLITLFSSLLMVFLVYRWVAWRTRSRVAALFASGILLTFFPVANWSASAKSDSMAVLLSLAGAYIVDRHGQGRRLWWAVPVLALAFYTRQTQLAAPLAAGLYLLALRPRRAIAFGAAYLASLAVPFVALDLLTNHGFYRHIVGYNQDTLEPQGVWRARQMVKTFLLTYAGYLSMALVGVLTLLRRLRVPFLAVYLSTSVATSSTVVATGSDFNHFLEFCAVASILVGIALGQGLSAGPPTLKLALALLLAAQVILRVPSILPGVYLPWQPDERETSRGAGVTEPPLWASLPGQEARETGDQLVSELSSISGPVLFELPAIALLADRRVVLDDPFVFVALSSSGTLQQDSILEQLRTGEIGLIALLVDVMPPGVHHSRLTDEMIAAVRENYQMVDTLPYPTPEGPRMYLYRPASGLQQSRAEALPEVPLNNQVRSLLLTNPAAFSKPPGGADK